MHTSDLFPALLLFSHHRQSPLLWLHSPLEHTSPGFRGQAFLSSTTGSPAAAPYVPGRQDCQPNLP